MRTCNPERVRISGVFDVQNPLAVRAASAHGAQFVQRVTRDTQRAIAALVAKGIEDGVPPARLAVEIRDMIGLTPRHTLAVQRARATWRAAGLRGGDLDKKVKAYTDRLLRWRARNIARTESIRAANSGQRAAWLHAAGTGILNPQRTLRRWIAAKDQRLCEQCASLHGKTARLDGAFPDGTEEPPAHPMCRCTTGLVFDQKLSPSNEAALTPQQKAWGKAYRDRQRLKKLGVVPPVAPPPPVSTPPVVPGVVIPPGLSPEERKKAVQRAAGARYRERQRLKRLGTPTPVRTAPAITVSEALWTESLPIPRTQEARLVMVTRINALRDELKKKNVNIEVGNLAKFDTPSGAARLARIHASAQSAMEGTLQLEKANVPIPRVVVTFNAEPKAQRYASHSVGLINFNTANETWDTLDAVRRRRESNVGINWSPHGTHHAGGTFVHEMGHRMHFDKLGFDQFVRSDLREPLDRDRTTLAILQVSRYAAHNSVEFVAETFSGMVYGQRYSPEVMSLYKLLGGYIPPGVEVP